MCDKWKYLKNQIKNRTKATCSFEGYTFDLPKDIMSRIL